MKSPATKPRKITKARKDESTKKSKRPSATALLGGAAAGAIVGGIAGGLHNGWDGILPGVGLGALVGGIGGAVGGAGIRLWQTRVKKIGKPPQDARIFQTDPNGKWVIFEDATGAKKIQFDVAEATRLGKDPLGPGTGSPKTEALIGPEGKVLVLEGQHRLVAAQGGAQIEVEKAEFLVYQDGLNSTCLKGGSKACQRLPWRAAT